MSFVAALLALILVTPALASDEPDELVPGRITIVKTATTFRFTGKPASGSLDLPDPSNDPTVEGGTLVASDTGGGAGTATFALPPGAGWRRIPTNVSKPLKGYRYKGAGSPTDPCRVVLVKKRVVKAVCKGSGVTLTTPFGGDVGIVVTLGTDSKQYCVRFGGTEARNDATLLKRSNAPALPVSCPVPGPTTTTTLPSCAGPGATCGSCTNGFCSTHVDPSPPTNVCANSSVCTPGTCTSDADCAGGQVCVQNPFPPGEILCCSPCP